LGATEADRKRNGNAKNQDKSENFLHNLCRS
jgi:hypothetical protein